MDNWLTFVAIVASAISVALSIFGLNAASRSAGAAERAAEEARRSADAGERSADAAEEANRLTQQQMAQMEPGFAVWTLRRLDSDVVELQNVGNEAAVEVSLVPHAAMLDRAVPVSNWQEIGPGESRTFPMSSAQADSSVGLQWRRPGKTKWRTWQGSAD